MFSIRAYNVISKPQICFRQSRFSHQPKGGFLNAGCFYGKFQRLWSQNCEAKEMTMILVSERWFSDSCLLMPFAATENVFSLAGPLDFPF